MNQEEKYAVLLDREAAEKLKDKAWIFVIEPLRVSNDVTIAVDTFRKRFEVFE